jgi:hypothetical protein
MAHEFKVVLDNVELSPEQERALSSAIQHAVLTHIAKLDLRQARGAPVVALGDGGGTQGIWYTEVSPETVRDLIPGFE